MLDSNKLDEAVEYLARAITLPVDDSEYIDNAIRTILTALSAYRRVADAVYEQYTDISTGVFGMTKLSELTKSLRDCGYEV